jgi:polysaccharide biosynthesis protein VpsQ
MRAIHWATGAFSLFLITIVVLANVGITGRVLSFIYEFPGGDKIGHLLLMGTFSLLLNLSLGARRLRLPYGSVQLGTAIALALVTVEELTQLLFKYRTFSLIDLAFDFAGILLFGWLAGYLLRRKA